MLPLPSFDNIYTQGEVNIMWSKNAVMKAIFHHVWLFFSFIELYDDHSRHSSFQQLLNSLRTPVAWFKHPPT